MANDPVLDALVARGIPGAVFQGGKLRFPFSSPGVGGASVAGSPDVAGTNVASGLASTPSYNTPGIGDDIPGNTKIGGADPIAEAMMNGEDIWPIIAGGLTAAGAGGYGLYRALRNRKTGANSNGGALTGMNSDEFGSNTEQQMKNNRQRRIGADSRTGFTMQPNDIVDAEFDVVSDPNRQIGYDDSAVSQFMRNRASVKRIGDNPTRRNDFMKSRTGVKALPAPPATVKEAPEAGLARILGVDSELAKMLKANPGLLRTLSRIK